MSVPVDSASLRRPEAEQGNAAQLDYRPEVDGLRAIAVLAVIGFHAAPRLVPGGFAGVDVFFVISGFLISGIVLRALARGSFSFLDFYVRRAKRIFPALAALLVSVWALGWLVLLSDEYKILGKHIVSGAGFVLNLTLYRDLNWYFGNITTPLIHLWSLGVEEQFYLLWPLFLVVIWRWQKGRFMLLFLATMLSFTVNAAAISSDPMASFYLPSGRLWELSLGGMLAYLQLNALKESDPTRAIFSSLPPPGLRIPSYQVRGIVGAVLLVTSFATLNATLAFPGWWAIVPCAGALLLISAGPHTWISRCVLATRPMVSIGRISYPLYLWHWPLLSLAHIVAYPQHTSAMIGGAVAAAFVLASLSYKYIELPVRHYQRNLRSAAIVFIVMLACGAIGYLTFVQTIPARSELHGVAQFVGAATEDWLPGTHDTEWTPVVDKFLTLGNGPRRVLFVGDSNIQQYYPRISKVLMDHPLNTHSAVFAARAGCALGAIEMVEAAYVPACRKFLQEVIQYAKDPGIDTIVIGACWVGYFVDSESLGAAGPLRPGTDRALEVLKQIIREFTNEGKHVYIVLHIPIGSSFDPRQMIRRTVLPPGFKVEIPTPTRADILKVVGPIVSKLVQIARDQGARVIDPIPSLCDEITCPAVTPDGEPMYHDNHHLRPSYVRENVRFLDETVLDVNTNGTADQILGHTKSMSRS